MRIKELTFHFAQAEVRKRRIEIITQDMPHQRRSRRTAVKKAGICQIFYGNIGFGILVDLTRARPTLNQYSPPLEVIQEQGERNLIDAYYGHSVGPHDEEIDERVVGSATNNHILGEGKDQDEQFDSLFQTGEYDKGDRANSDEGHGDLVEPLRNNSAGNRQMIWMDAL